MKLKMKAVGTTLHLNDRVFNNTKYVAEIIKKEKAKDVKFDIEMYQSENSLIIKMKGDSPISYEIKKELSKESALKLINKITESDFTELVID